jgi:hypothetical protein
MNQQLAKAAKITHSKLASKNVIKSVAVKDYVSYRGKFILLLI